MKKLASALLVFGTLAGCSGSSSADICAQQAALVCQFLFDCCNASERAQLLNLDSSSPNVGFGNVNGAALLVPFDSSVGRSDCEDRLANQCTAQGAALDVAVEEERASVDLAMFETCIKPLKEAVNACDTTKIMTFNASSTECRTYRTGKVAKGGACYENFECSENASCERTNNQGQGERVQHLAGVCGDAAPFVQEGADCRDAQCDPSLYCAEGPMGARTCARFAQSGQACGNNNVPCDPRAMLECMNNVCVVQNNVTYDYCHGPA